MIDLRNRRAVIFGLQGSGKTELAKHILRSTPDHLVYDTIGQTNSDFADFRRYVPRDRNTPGELSTVVEKVVIPYKPKLFVVDEANKFVQPKPRPLPPGIADLNDLSRHWDVAWILIARRPTQFHTDVTELAHYIFAFQLPGKNDRRFFDNISPGLGNVVASLPRYHFVVISANKDYYIHAPVDCNA